MSWWQREITSHQWDLRWFGDGSRLGKFYDRLSIYYAAWIFIMPSVYWGICWAVALMLPFLPCILVNHRELKIKAEAHAKEAERLRRAQHARDLVWDSTTFGAIRSYVAKGHFETALSCINVMKTEELSMQANQYVMDHWHRFGPLIGQCIQCGGLVAVENEEEQKECTSCALAKFF